MIDYLKNSLVIILLLAVSLAAEGSWPGSFTVNGLKVIYTENTTTDVVSVRMYFRGGALQLNNNLAGIENFALRVAKKATRNYPKDRLNAALERMNSRITVSVSRDYSALNLLCVSENFNESWNIFTDILKNPLFNEEDVKLEREQILSSIRERKDDPDRYLDEINDRAFYVNHPYTVDARGTDRTISGFTGLQLNKYLRSRLKTSHLLLVVAGDIDSKRLEGLVSEAFSDLPVGEYSPENLPDIRHQESSLKIVQRDLPTKYIQGYFPAGKYGDSKSYAMRLALSLLRDRLWEEIRTKRGLSYAPSAGYGSYFANYGYIYVTAVDVDTTMEVMMREVRRMIEEPVPDEELKNKVNVFITRYYLRNETNEAQANLLARYELAGAGYSETQKIIDYLQKVTPTDIQDVCSQYMKNIQYVLLGNPDRIDVANFAF